MYSCTCEEDCYEEKQVICQMNPEINIRQGCKYCRYLRCLEAGMVAQMVIKDASESNFNVKKKSKESIAKKIETPLHIDENLLTISQSINMVKCKETSPTKIIDIAENFRQKLPFWNNDVKRSLVCYWHYAYWHNEQEYTLLKNNLFMISGL